MKYFNAILVVGILIFVSSCTKPKEEEANGNDNEVYTTFQVTFTDTLGVQAPKTFVFRDLDGVGGNNPSRFDTIQLSPSTVYFMDILVLNEAMSPADTISNEIRNEANVHQFFYSFDRGYLSHTYLDSDTNSPPLPIGLHNLWTVSAASFSDYLRIVLKHYSNGAKNGSSTSGTSDIDVTFPIKVQ